MAVANRVACGALSALSLLPLVGALASVRLPRAMRDCLEQARRAEGEHVHGVIAADAGQGEWAIVGSCIGPASEGRGYVLAMIPARALNDA